MTDVFTLVVLTAWLFSLLAVDLARVRAITTLYDYVILLIAEAFLTGQFAYHQWFHYEQ